MQIISLLTLPVIKTGQSARKEFPSLTIEVGRDTVPVPEEQFDEIWNANKNVWEECVCAD